MTNDVCRDESSVPVNFTVTVCPAREEAPDSKPGLASFWPEQPPGLPVGVAVGVGVGVGVPLVQVASPDWAGTLTAFQAALTVLNRPQVASRFLAASRVQTR